jgi:hypothetical protein
MARALQALECRRQWAHLTVMERATKRPDDFRKPAHWTSDPPPKPAPPKGEEELSPTRYGDWTLKGVAVDF